MKSMPAGVSTPGVLQLLSVAALAMPLIAGAQGFCASDGQPRPTALLERFINADCGGCWRDATAPVAAKGGTVLDWVVPGSKGSDAPLAAVATTDGLKRLAALGVAPPPAMSALAHRVTGLRGGQLRVAHGVVLNGYAGASIELKPVPASIRGKELKAWLVLAETLPAGTEGSPVARNLIRNMLQPNRYGGQQLSKEEQKRFYESRVMSVPEGAHPERLLVIGWVEDANGQVLTAAQSRCIPVKDGTR